MPVPFSWIGGYWSGGEPLTALITSTVFPPGGCGKVSTCYCLLGRVWALWAHQDHLDVSCQCKAFPPDRNSWAHGSSLGGLPKSSGSGCNQFEWSPHAISSAQDSSWELSAQMLGLSSNVTCHLECDRLGDWALLLVWCKDARDSLLCGSAVLDLLHQWLHGHLWLPDFQWPWLMEWLNLSILSSRRAAATNAHLWASCATARACLQDTSFRSLKWSRCCVPSAGTWTEGLAWKCQWIFALVPLLTGHIPTCDRGAPWWSWGFPGRYSPPPPHDMGSHWAPSSDWYTLL